MLITNLHWSLHFRCKHKTMHRQA